MDGVVKPGPVPNDDPPLDTLNQFKVPPAQPDADSATVPFPHLEFVVTVGAAGIALIIAVTAVRGPSQPAALVQDT